MHDLHSILLKIPDILSTSSDNEVDINLKLSINLSLCAIFYHDHILLIVTEKVIYFSISSPMQLHSPLNSSTNWLIIK